MKKQERIANNWKKIEKAKNLFNESVIQISVADFTKVIQDMEELVIENVELREQLHQTGETGHTFEKAEAVTNERLLPLGTRVIMKHDPKREVKKITGQILSQGATSPYRYRIEGEKFIADQKDFIFADSVRYGLEINQEVVKECLDPKEAYREALEIFEETSVFHKVVVVEDQEQ